MEYGKKKLKWYSNLPSLVQEIDLLKTAVGKHRS